MGYTHYWTFKRPLRGTAKTVETAYQHAMYDIAKIAKAYQSEVDALGFECDRLSGYTVHTKIGAYGGVKINGKAELACEDFALREHYSQNEYGFCKTDRNPYDVVVSAALSVLKTRLGDLIEIRSDGDFADLDAGLKYAKIILKRKNLIHPLGKRTKLKLLKIA